MAFFNNQLCCRNNDRDDDCEPGFPDKVLCAVESFFVRVLRMGKYWVFIDAGAGLSATGG